MQMFDHHDRIIIIMLHQWFLVQRFKWGEVKGRNACNDGGLLGSAVGSAVSFFILNVACPLTSGNRSDDVRERPKDSWKDR